MPALSGGGRGDQLVTVTLRTPAKLSEDQRELFERLAEFEGEEAEESGLFERVKSIFN